jgi:DNA-binding NtrC family response regulator
VDVLVVEDDPLVRETVACGLEDDGLEVATAPTAELAIEAAAATGAPAVLVTDVDLGAGLDGVALAAIFAGRWPEVAVVFITGREDRHLDNHRLGPRQCLVPKPFSLGALAGIVRGFVERRQPGTEARASSATDSEAFLSSRAGQQGGGTTASRQPVWRPPSDVLAGRTGPSSDNASCDLQC